MELTIKYNSGTTQQKIIYLFNVLDIHSGEIGKKLKSYMFKI